MQSRVNRECEHTIHNTQHIHTRALDSTFGQDVLNCVFGGAQAAHSAVNMLIFSSLNMLCTAIFNTFQIQTISSDIDRWRHIFLIYFSSVSMVLGWIPTCSMHTSASAL